MPGPFISQGDVENALGKNLVRAIYDDDGDQVVDPAPMAACCAYACAQVAAFLLNEYDFDLTTLSPVPDALRFAAVDFACAYTARRRPDIFKAMNETAWKDFRSAAIDNIRLFAAGVERVPDNVEVPKNIGGLSVDDSHRIATNAADGTNKLGDF